MHFKRWASASIFTGLAGFSIICAPARAEERRVDAVILGKAVTLAPGEGLVRYQDGCAGIAESFKAGDVTLRESPLRWSGACVAGLADGEGKLWQGDETKAGLTRMAMGRHSVVNRPENGSFGHLVGNIAVWMTDSDGMMLGKGGNPRAGIAIEQFDETGKKTVTFVLRKRFIACKDVVNATNDSDYAREPASLAHFETARNQCRKLIESGSVADAGNSLGLRTVALSQVDAVTDQPVSYTYACAFEAPGKITSQAYCLAKWDELALPAKAAADDIIAKARERQASHDAIATAMRVTLPPFVKRQIAKAEEEKAAKAAADAQALADAAALVAAAALPPVVAAPAPAVVAAPVAAAGNLAAVAVDGFAPSMAISQPGQGAVSVPVPAIVPPAPLPVAVPALVVEAIPTPTPAVPTPAVPTPAIESSNPAIFIGTTAPVITEAAPKMAAVTPLPVRTRLTINLLDRIDEETARLAGKPGGDAGLKLLQQAWAANRARQALDEANPDRASPEGRELASRVTSAEQAVRSQCLGLPDASEPKRQACLSGQFIGTPEDLHLLERQAIQAREAVPVDADKNPLAAAKPGYRLKRAATLAATDCVESGQEDGAAVGMFINRCDYYVMYAYCMRNAEADSWSALFDCDRHGVRGYGLLVPQGRDAAHNRHGGSVLIFACEWLPKAGFGPDGIMGLPLYQLGRGITGQCGRQEWVPN